MYIPQPFAETRIEELVRIIRDNPLGALVTHSAKGLDANHIPFEFESGEGASGILRAHVARANPLLTDLADGAEVLVIFRGAQGYISPNWYPSKHETHRLVPTWNYEVVHARGTLHIADEERFVRGVLARLTRHHESSEPTPWKMGDAPPAFVAELVKAVVGIEIAVTRLEGKRKLSQNREARDAEGAISALERNGNTPLSQSMASARP